jgi:nicotinate-nucleotide adenylyltransferase
MEVGASGRRSATTLMRIGLFGGTFDPIHNGHLRAALDVCEAFPLDRCILVPAAKPPHKIRGDTSGVDHRLTMARAAVEGIEQLEVSEVEARRKGPSFTIDTVRHFRQTLPAGTALFLLLGADAFFDIDSWHAWQELMDEVPPLVMTRPGFSRDDFAAALDDFISGHLAEGYSWDRGRSGFFHPRRPPVHYFPVTMLDISATDIRKRVRQGRSIRFLLPHAVERYIFEKELYR